MRRKTGALVPFEIAICVVAARLHADDVVSFHGYLLAKALRAETDKAPGFGTLYRALGRLEQMGLLASVWEDPHLAAQENRPRRRLYLMTDAGLTVATDARRTRAVGATSVVQVGTRMTPQTAVRLVRWWTSLYTVVLPPEARAARRQEVESDLWESLADPDAADDILPRWLHGVADDLAWSAEHMDTTGRASVWGSIGVLLTISVSWLWLANSPASATMRESFWAFPVALTFHLLGLVCLFGLRGAVDLRLTGHAFTDSNVSTLMRHLRPWTIGFAILTVATGAALYMADPARVAANPLFRLKLGALALMVVNTGFVQAMALRDVDAWEAGARPPILARVSGYVSLLLWAIVIVAGRLMPFDFFA